ncbi:type III secretion system (T3SS) protein LEE [Cupriavidus gilardii J11]|uniref:Type III secretion system (T3SS) protein LEE n=1 Tax=Cupriavidus gilardii J11 TaxID=936133 RepID=A0A562BI79_9BURK|nr:type III secretion system domain-containing protein [Cupriavidus gilardii]TWG84967.1 type III secretion system (T3SS) protein LEE [Cupriavidus gilardii J11]
MRAPESAVPVGVRCQALCPAVQRLHELAWRPGASMHAAWWDHLGLSAWKTDYDRHPGCRRALDALIVQRRGFPAAPLPAVLSDEQKRMLSLESRLPMLVVALGIVVARAPELLMLGSYRRQLLPVLGSDGCDQLAALIPEGRGAMAVEPPSPLVEWLRGLGSHWLEQTLPGSVIWQALSACLPPVSASAAGGPVIAPPGLALPMLFRLDRLL